MENDKPKLVVPNEAELIEYELWHEREVWLVHKGIDDRAGHNNGSALQERKKAMSRIDGLLDRMLELS